MTPAEHGRVAAVLLDDIEHRTEEWSDQAVIEAFASSFVHALLALAPTTLDTAVEGEAAAAPSTTPQFVKHKATIAVAA